MRQMPDLSIALMQSLSALEIKVAKLEQLNFEQEKKLHDIKALRSEIEVLRSEIKVLRHQNLATLNEVAHRDQLLREIRNSYEGSTSWRITRPLRRLRQLLGKNKAAEVVPLVEVDCVPPAPAEPSRSDHTQDRRKATCFAVADRLDYKEWIHQFDAVSAEQLAPIQEKALSSLEPTLVTLLSVFSAPHFCETDLSRVQAVRANLVGQHHPHWEWLIVCEPETLEHLKGWASSETRIRLIDAGINKASPGVALNAGLQLANGEWLAWIDDRVQLREHALLSALGSLRAHPTARLLYADDDRMDSQGIRSKPAFRCDVNLDLLNASDYLGQLVFCRREDLIEVGGWDNSLRGAHRHDLWLRLTERWKEPAQAIKHLPRILSHRRPENAEEATVVMLPCWTEEGNLSAGDQHSVPLVVQAHLNRLGLNAVARPHPSLPEACSVRFTLPEPPPRVGIVIPTRDNVGVLSVCLASLLEQSTYPDLRVVIVDNGSVKPETLAYLTAIDDPRVQLIRDDAPFNFSRLINRGAAAVEGEVLCLLNNDMQITQPDWLEEMVGWALQDGVAAVGARLWYGEGALQHGGIVLGIQGVAGHAHKHLAKGEPGYLNRAVLHQTMSAVTGACMVVRRSVFDEVGGFDEALGVAYNDVDFCLRARMAGYRNVWTPHAEMIHHESISRGFEDSPEKQARFQREAALMQERWVEWLANDPAYNPNLTLDYEDFGLAWPPRASVT